MLNTLCDYLDKSPGLYIEDMAVFLLDEFIVLSS